MRGKKRFNQILIAMIMIWVISLPFGIIAEKSPWNCPFCGRTGNTGNFCGKCAHPAPWMETPKEESTLIPGTVPYSIVSFGSNPYASEKKPLEWITLDTGEDDNGKYAYLLCRYIIDYEPFHDKYSRTTWKNSGLRNALNQGGRNPNRLKYILFDTQWWSNWFTKEEQARMIPQKVITGNTDDEDKVWLLSLEEYLTKKEQLLPLLFDVYDDSIYNYMNPIVEGWWLQDSGTERSKAMYVDNSGDYSEMGVNISCGVRPVICIYLENH